MPNLRKRVTDLERSHRLGVAIVHAVLVSSPAEERAEAERLSREAPDAEHMFIRLMGPEDEDWPEEVAH